VLINIVMFPFIVGHRNMTQYSEGTSNTVIKTNMTKPNEVAVLIEVEYNGKNCSLLLCKSY
jgi:hypothetical protein